MRYKFFFLLMAITLCGCNDSLRTNPNTTTSTDTSSSSTTTTGSGTASHVGGTANDKTIRDGQPVTSKDPASSAKTPFDQGNNAQDLQITADIRKRVVDTNMSTSAHNVNIITLNGKVTLKGSVASLKEKETIEEIAHAVAGAESVQSQLEVK